MLNWSGGLEEFACLLGNTYGELTVLEVMDSFNGSKIIRKGLFRCSCGKEVVAPLKNVLYGGKLSCGHLVGSKKDYSHLIGQTFNELTILKISEPINQKTTSRKCTCLCSCGKKTSPTLYSVLNGQVKSCGHLRGETLGKRKSLRENVDELIGKVYGKVTILTVTEPIKEKGSHRICTYRCSCGREEEAYLYVVKNRNENMSCRHCKTWKRAKDYSYLFGQQVGELTIVSYSKNKEMDNEKEPRFLFRCSCGYEFESPLKFPTHHYQGTTNAPQKVCPNCHKSFYELNPKVSSFYGDLSIKNIHWDARERKFVISVKRRGLWFKARAKTLSEAIEKRDELLNESKEFIESLNQQ